MFIPFAHAGHSHESIESISTIDYCMPIIVGAAAIITILLVVIVYLLATWQPKGKKKSTKR